MIAIVYTEISCTQQRCAADGICIRKHFADTIVDTIFDASANADSPQEKRIPRCNVSAL